MQIWLGDSLKILQISPDSMPYLRGGGTETFSLLVKMWTEEGHEVTQLASVPAAISNPDTEKSYNHTVTFFKLVNAPDFVRESSYFFPLRWRERSRLSSMLSDLARDCDLIVIHGFLEALPRFALLHLPENVRTRVVVTDHGIPLASYSIFLSMASWLFYRSIGRIILSRVKYIVVYSQQSLADLHRFCGRLRGAKVIKLFSGVEINGLRSSYHEAKSRQTELEEILLSEHGVIGPYLYAIGRLVRTKGFDILIRAFSLVSSAYPELQLVISGDDNGYGKELEELIDELGLGSRVKFTGRVSQVIKVHLMLNCKVFVIPSRREGYGLNAVEAAILRIPTVATDTGAHSDTLQGKDFACIVAPEDIDSLKAAIIDLMRYGDDGRFYDVDEAIRHDIKRLADSYLAITKL
ncbi:MAG: glycosyltransferase family 4 protein [Thermoplasmatales archaeon]|nr:glycosyltransferase family 4 protein [Thermoplasmatales archaeon]